MKFSKIASLVLVGGLALGGLTACGSTQQNPDYARMCVDSRTHDRVPGNECAQGDANNASNAFIWWYILYGSRMPAYGQPVNYGQHTLANKYSYAPTEKAPAGKTYTKPSKTYTPPKAVPPKYVAPAPKPAPAPKAPGSTYKAPTNTYKAPTYRAPSIPRSYK